VSNATLVEKLFFNYDDPPVGAHSENPRIRLNELSCRDTSMTLTDHTGQRILEVAD
jgi:hypothetical protein